MKRLLLLLLTAILIAGCGGAANLDPTQEAQVAELALALISTPLAPGTFQATRLAATTLTPPSGATDVPTPTPTPKPPNTVQDWRAPLTAGALTLGAMETLFEIADQLQAGQIDRFSASSELLGVAVVLKAADDVLLNWEPLVAQQPYQPALREQISEVQRVIQQWQDREITSADIRSVLADDYQALTQMLEGMLRLMKAYGITYDEIQALLSEIEQALPSPIE